jgi:hypothetical protein
MRFFAIWIEHALDMTVRRPHNTNPRQHRWPVLLNHQEQRLHCGLPFGRLRFGFGELGDVSAGVLERDELATRGNRIGSSNGLSQPPPILPRIVLTFGSAMLRSIQRFGQARRVSSGNRRASGRFRSFRFIVRPSFAAFLRIDLGGSLN